MRYTVDHTNLSAFPRFSLIVPAHNEESRIGSTILDYLDSFADSEVILVLNGCTDGTEAAAYRAANGRRNLRLLHIDHAVGKGGAVRAGFLAARAPIVGYVDADGATSGTEMRRLFELMRPGVDGVIASRWVRGARVEVAQRLLRRIVSRGFNTAVRVLFGLPYSDTQCGAKVFSSAAIAEIADSLEVSNFAFDIDVLYALRRASRNVIEVPTTWRDVAGSKIGNVAAASRLMLQAILRLRMTHSLFRYVIPLFDRIWPTSPLRVCGGLSVLILNWRDPKHPQAGGAEKYLFEVARRLVGRGHRVHWLTAGFAGGTPKDAMEGVKITRVGNKFTVYGLIPITYLRDFRDTYDVIVDAENGIPFFSPLFSLKPKLLLMFHVHQRVFEKHLPFPISTFFKWIEAKFMPAVYAGSRFVAISNDTKSEVQTALGVDGDRIDLAVSGIDPSLEPGTKSARPTILSLGRLKAYKRIDLLVKALPEIVRAVPDVELVIAGSGDQEAVLRALAREHGVESSVRFDGFVTDDRKRELMQRAWVFAMPSEMEGWGLTVIEANACGTPCVGFDVPGVGESIVHGVSGLIVNARQPIGPALVKLLTDASLRSKLSIGAENRARAFSWEATTTAFVDAMMHEVTRSHTRYVRAGEDDWSVLHSKASSRSSAMRREFEVTSSQS